MDISWNFFKITLRADLPFERRKQMLIERFRNADTYRRTFRGTEYKYQIYDLEVTTVSDDNRQYVVGRLMRSPKLARGRRLDSGTRQSEPGEVDIDAIADSTEFIYDLDSCVLALHRRAPFTGLTTIRLVWSQLIGQPIQVPGSATATDVHVEILRDAEYVDTVLDTPDRLIEVKLKYARPNPGGDDHSLHQIHLGLIGEEIDADEAAFNARRVGGGSLDKSQDGFIRRSIRSLLENGYLKKGILLIGSHLIDVLEAKEKTRETSGYERNENGQDLSLREHAAKWLRQLLTNADIYPQDGHNE